MEYQATAKYIRISPRKLRLVADSVRSLSPNQATMALSQLSKAAAKPLREVIASAIANAKQKQAKAENLRFRVIEVMEGPVMKRWHAASRGMAHEFKKRMTHVRVVLTDETRPNQKEVKR